MATRLALRVFLLLSCLGASSASPYHQEPCGIRNVATGQEIRGELFREGTYLFAWQHPHCRARTQRLRNFDSQYSLKLRFAPVVPPSVCPCRVNVHDLSRRREPLLGVIDLCGSHLCPMTLYLDTPQAVLALAGPSTANFTVQMDYVSRETKVDVAANPEWAALTSPGCPMGRLAPSTDIAFSFRAPSAQWTVELLLDARLLGRSLGSRCHVDCLTVLDRDGSTPSRQQSWCRPARRFLSSGHLVTVNFHVDARCWGRSLRLWYRAVQRPVVRRQEEVHTLWKLACVLLLVYAVGLGALGRQWHRRRVREEKQRSSVHSLLLAYADSRRAGIDSKSAGEIKLPTEESVVGGTVQVSLISSACSESQLAGKHSGSPRFVHDAFLVLMVVYLLLVGLFGFHCYRLHAFYSERSAW